MEFLENRADAVVEVGEHGGKNAAVNVFDVGKTLHVGVRPLQRTVDGVVCQVQQKRSLLVTIDEVDGFAGECVGQVLPFVDGLPVAEDGVVGVVGRFVGAHVRGVNAFAVGTSPTALLAVGQRATAEHRRHALVRRGHEEMAFVQKTEELVEAAADRMVFRVSAQMPLADEGGRVADVVQLPCERAFGFR